MNRIIRAVIEVPSGILKAAVSNLLYQSRISPLCAIAPTAEIGISFGASVRIGAYFRARSGSHIRVRKGGVLRIGNSVSVNHGCMIVCHDRIRIGNDVQFSPNVMVYDHDHDYQAPGGVKSMRYKTSPVTIGDNVWIGANSVILRGTVIGDRAVIAAGSVVKGRIPADSLVYGRRKTVARPIQ